MKKMAHVRKFAIYMHDSTEYLKIEKDGQHIGDKYVDYNGDKINSSRYNSKKDRLIIRRLYWIVFEVDNFYWIWFRNFRNYSYFNLDESNKINKILNTKNSFFDYDSFGDFDHVKKRIIDIFSERMKVKTE